MELIHESTASVLLNDSMVASMIRVIYRKFGSKYIGLIYRIILSAILTFMLLA